MRRVAWWLALVSLVPLGVVVASRATGFEPGAMALLVAFTPWVTLALLAPLALAILARSRWLSVVAALLIALCVAWQVPLFTGGSDGDPALTVATANMTLGGADASAVVALVRDHAVDVLAVQELTSESENALELAGLSRQLPFRATFPEPGVPGTGLWSRYPLTDVIDVPGFTAHVIEATVGMESGPITVFAIHPQAPGKRNHDNWLADLERLKEVLADVSGAVVVAGDFNTTRDQVGFRRIEGLGYVDAANQAGSGFAPTFPEHRRPWPLVAIDHVLERDSGMVAQRTETVIIAGSDHRALVVVYGAAP